MRTSSLEHKAKLVIEDLLKSPQYNERIKNIREYAPKTEFEIQVDHDNKKFIICFTCKETAVAFYNLIRRADIMHEYQIKAWVMDFLEELIVKAALAGLPNLTMN